VIEAGLKIVRYWRTPAEENLDIVLPDG